jgi:hypothetical protein
VERREQAGQIRIGRCRIAARHLMPERDRAPVHEQRLIDLFIDANRRNVRRGQPASDAQFLLHPAQPVSLAGDPDHNWGGG